MKNKNVLITGGSGFIGSTLAKRLLEKNYNITVFDNNSRGSKSKLSNIIEDIKFYEGDIRNKNDVFEAMKKCEHVFHLSFINGTKYFYEKPELVLDVGIKGALNTIECAKELNIETYIMASSSEIYNEPTSIPTTESERAIVTDIKNPRFSYASGKLISEILTVNYFRDTKIRDLIFRPHNVFGPDMGFEHVLPEIVKKIMLSSEKSDNNDIDIKIQGDGTETRAFCFIEEAVKQLIIIFECGIKGEIYNVGLQKEVSINQLIGDISNIMNKNINIVPGKITKGSTKRRCPDISKVSSLGYKEEDSYLKGLKLTIDWYKNYYSLNNN